ncbi:SHOCT domain-containing protein [Thermotoga sp. KOL6]|uniref:SHOCT domain-containing protein n=1 Tax=Thermotoga sp. KOL6 TaxID=126741 RepID=UPI0026F46988|nr:SHOCT domain-containing protein [Thermotoga sp. KOL6]
MMVFWAVILVVLFVLLFRWIEGNRTHERDAGNQRAIELLKERLARGEISEEEYERLRRRLED